jgi:D-amino-acid oxidase
VLASVAVPAGERIVVVGAGVAGLSCAFELLDAGFDVEIWSDRPPAETTSAVAAAFWFPYRVEPPERVAVWARASYDRFAALSHDHATGVRFVPVLELTDRSQPAPQWRADLRGFTTVPGDAAGEGTGSAFAYEAPVVSMPLYLPWLEAQVAARGGTIVRRRLSSLEEALAVASQVVHCSGLGARGLVGDDSMEPVAGQVVRVRGAPVEGVFVDENDPRGPVYVVPRGDDIIVGGTAVAGEDNPQPSAQVRAHILERALALCPALAGAEFLEDRVGVRPCRPEVRLEREGRVIHDYGHGGAGVTLSWGCAAEVRALALGAVGPVS